MCLDRKFNILLTSIMKKTFPLLIILAAIGAPLLQAEVQSFSMIWNAPLCTPSCAAQLTQRLSHNTPGVQKAEVSQAAGRADVVWDPRVPFSFQPINNSVRYVGIRPRLFRIRVRGTVQDVNGRNFTLISTGDNTPFVLRGPIQPSLNRYTEQYNPQSHFLNPQLIQQLSNIARARQTVVIEGPFFEPFRSPPNQLIIETLSVEEEKKRP